MANNKVIPITGNISEWIKAITIGLQCTKAAMKEASIGIADSEGMHNGADELKGIAALQSATTVLGEILKCTEVSAAENAIGMDSNSATVCVLNGKQTNTILTALRSLQCGTLIALESSSRSDDLLSKEEIDALCAQLVTPANDATVIETLKSNGMDLAVCTKAFAAEETNLYVLYARQNLTSYEAELDDAVCIAPGSDGAFVMMWHWVSSREAGFVPNSECLELLFDAATEKLSKERMATAEHKRTAVYLGWLEDLIGNFADEIDSIADATDLRSGPHAIDWRDEHQQTHTFAPSEALSWLHNYAYNGEQNASNEQHVFAFITAHGKTLDSVLSCVATN